MSVYGRYNRQFGPRSKSSLRGQQQYLARTAEERARQQAALAERREAAVAALREREEQMRAAGPPEPIPIRTFKDAEQNAANWMVWLGFTYVSLTVNGADGGIDVNALEAVAQVKAEVRPVGAPPVREIAGVAAANKKVALFFALGGYTPAAVAFGQQAQVGLFTFDLMGTPKPANLMAETMVNARLRHGRQVPETVRRGPDAIFGTGPYPRALHEFIGQSLAKQQISTAMVSSAERGVPMDHMLLESGDPGIGKTALAKIVAATLNVGYAEVGDAATAEVIRPILQAMRERDVLFIEDVGRLWSSDETVAEWLRLLLRDDVWVTVIAAITDRHDIPQEILGWFPLQVFLDPYSEVEAVEIVKTIARKLGIVVEQADVLQIARAAGNNPRLIDRICTTARDVVAMKSDPDPVATAIKRCVQSAND